MLTDLVEHTSIDKFGLSCASAPVLRLCQELCYRSELEVAAGATHLLCSLAANCLKEMHHVEGKSGFFLPLRSKFETVIFVPGFDISGEAIMAVEALLLLLNSGAKQGNRGTFKVSFS